MQPIPTDDKLPSRQLRQSIDGALSRDRGRLLGLWSKWQATPADAGLRDAFATKLQASVISSIFFSFGRWRPPVMRMQSSSTVSILLNTLKELKGS